VQRPELRRYFTGEALERRKAAIIVPGSRACRIVNAQELSKALYRPLLGTWSGVCIGVAEGFCRRLQVKSSLFHPACSVLLLDTAIAARHRPPVCGLD